MSHCNQYHDPEPELSYLRWHDDAEKRHKHGERQTKCPACGKWIWDAFYHTKPKESPK